MANIDEVSNLKVEQLKELAAEHNVEVLAADKKDDLVLKIADAITPEQLEAYTSKDQGSEIETEDAPLSDKDRELKENADKVETRKEDAKEVETELGTSKEESAAERAGVPDEKLNSPTQNREPKNEFEQSNQKVTEEERVAAQKVSSMSTETKEDKTPTPNEAGKADAVQTTQTNQGSEIAQAIREATTGQKNFQIQSDDTVDPRFTVVKNKDGEVMIRENETGHLSKVQLESIEEKQASLQNQEVEEV
jgi:hypothetical protein